MFLQKLKNVGTTIWSGITALLPTSMIVFSKIKEGLASFVKHTRADFVDASRSIIVTRLVWLGVFFVLGVIVG